MNPTLAGAPPRSASFAASKGYSDIPTILELCRSGCDSPTSSVPQYPQNAS